MRRMIARFSTVRREIPPSANEFGGPVSIKKKKQLYPWLRSDGASERDREQATWGSRGRGEIKLKSRVE